MENKRTNRKAQIDSTLVWFFAIFIIMFILIIFITIAFLMADQKSLFGNPGATETAIGSSNDIGVSESLFSLLNSEISYNGKNIRVIDAVFSSFDSYFETKSSGINLIQKYGLDNYDDISRTTKEQMIKDGFDSAQIDNISNQNQMLALEVKKKLDNYCTKYRFAVPQGVISEDGKLESSDSLGNRIYFLMNKGDPFPADWTPTVVFNVSYRGVITNIQFVELKNCSGQGTLGGQK